MIKVFIVTVLFTLAACEKAEIRDLFDSYLWQKRVLLVFTPNKDHPQFHKQQATLLQHTSGVKERDLVTWVFIQDNYVMVDGAYKPQLPVDQFYEYFDANNEEFTVVLLGKDGNEKLRQHASIVSSEELFKLIDAMPMRQREILKNKNSHSIVNIHTDWRTCDGRRKSKEYLGY